MKAISITTPGAPEVLQLIDAPDPQPAAGEVLLQVAATAVNRADLLQRQGMYPPPPGASLFPGLEASGTVIALGDGVQGWKVGDTACALLAGGGYAEKVAVPAGQLLPIPKGVSLVDAAALPEVACTVWSNVFMLAGLKSGELFLMHGGSSGIGTMAIQLARALGARVAVTAGSQDKLDRCRELGAEILVNYRNQDFVEEVKKASDKNAKDGRGANVILDIMGAQYLMRNIDALAVKGRMVIIGLQSGTKTEIDLSKVMPKRISIHGTTLRAQSVADKATIVASVREHVWPLVEQGKVKPIVHVRLPLSEAAQAHRIVQESTHVGKVVLVV